MYTHNLPNAQRAKVLCRPGYRCAFGLIFFVFGFLGHTGLVRAQSFTRITDRVGLGGMSETNGVALADYDRDGDIDIYLVSKKAFEPNDSKTWNRLYVNVGNGVFTSQSSPLNLTGQSYNSVESPMGYKMGASWGDFNNDGWPDLYLTHLGPNQLLKNNGDGTFEDITQFAGVAGGATQLSSSSLWWDFDNDGDLDLYVSTYEDFTAAERNIENLLFENLGNESFVEVGEASGVHDAEPTWMSVAVDANNDGLLDLYLANDFGPNTLYINVGDHTFVEQVAEFGVEDRFHGMGIAIGDCDNNGFFDIYLTNITETGFDREINPLFLNSGQNTFSNVSTEAGVHLAGWGWGTSFMDIENDGDEDLFVATGYFDPDYENVLFQNQLEGGQAVFMNITADLALDDKRTARGLAVFDFDSDGDEDILVSNFFDTPSLYENPLFNSTWLQVKLEGTDSNRDALGAVVTVYTSGVSHKKYHHGAQFLGQNLLPLHFGLNGLDVVEKVIVEWPTGTIEVIDWVPANQSIKVVEGQGLVTGTLVSQEREASLPVDLALVSNFPNPFREYTHIQFELSQPGVVTLEIFDLLGRLLQTTTYTYSTAGIKTIKWAPGKNYLSSQGSKSLFYRLKHANASASQIVGHMILLKG